MHYLRCTVHLRWWLKPYLYGVALMAIALNAEPDWQKVEDTVVRGLRVELEPVCFAVLA